MTLLDLETVLSWAAAEGWNPGLDDAPAFFAADPDGFLVKTVDGQLVAAISVVNHDAHFAFLGLYLCKLEFRGKGYGIEVWRAGMAHAGTRSVGLDGVPDQQDNYAKSGFVKYSSTIRFEGHIAAAPTPRVRIATPQDVQTIIGNDLESTGTNRTAFATTWFTKTLNRQTIVLDGGGYATFRRCGEGVKIGPLCANSEADARALLAANPFQPSQGPLFVDVPGADSALAGLLQTLGFQPVFETARMFNGPCPDANPAPYSAIATMELG